MVGGAISSAFLHVILAGGLLGTASLASGGLIFSMVMSCSRMRSSFVSTTSISTTLVPDGVSVSRNRDRSALRPFCLSLVSPLLFVTACEAVGSAECDNGHFIRDL